MLTEHLFYGLLVNSVHRQINNIVESQLVSVKRNKPNLSRIIFRDLNIIEATTLVSDITTCDIQMREEFFIIFGSVQLLSIFSQNTGLIDECQFLLLPVVALLLLRFRCLLKLLLLVQLLLQGLRR